MQFTDRLATAIRQKRTPVLVGLDPRAAMLPQSLQPETKDPQRIADRFQQFCCGVIDAVAPLVPAVKPQAAFFEELGWPGLAALSTIIQYASSRGLIVILDAKRGDIGSTAQAYARGLLQPGTAAVSEAREGATDGHGGPSQFAADALTVNPYLGGDSLAPFVDVAVERNCGIFVLVKTSNPGGGMFQDLVASGRPVYEHVAEHVQSLATAHTAECGYGAVGAVVGATYPQQLTELRTAMPQTWLLVPGFGSQGGGPGDVAAAFDARGMGAVINNSRGIIFAHRRPEYERFGERRWQQAVETATTDMMAALQAETPAGRL